MNKNNIIISFVESLRYDILPQFREDGIISDQSKTDTFDTENLKTLLNEKSSLETMLNHSVHMSSSPNVASLLTGLYPREHQLCGEHRSLSPDIQTIPDLLETQGYHTLILNGNEWFSKNGIYSRFQQRILGPIERAVRVIKKKNKENTPVFAFLYSQDISAPYMLSQYPPTELYHVQPAEIANKLKTMFASNQEIREENFDIHSGHFPTNNWEIPWAGSEQVPLWKFYIEQVYRDHKKEKPSLKNRIETLIKFYVKGINAWDQYQFNSLTDFLLEEESDIENTFIMTGDRGDFIYEDNDQKTFGRTEKPIEEALRVPLIYMDENGDSLNLSEDRLISQVDVPATLLEGMDLDIDHDMSGRSLRKPTSEERIIFADSTRSVPPDESEFEIDNNRSNEDLFPFQCILNWITILNYDGFKINHLGIGVQEKDFERNLKDFFFRVAGECFSEPLSNEQINSRISDFDNSLQNKKNFVEILESKMDQEQIEVFNWRKDPCEKKNIMNDREKLEDNIERIENLRTLLVNQFPAPIDLEINELEETESSEEISTREPIQGVGYIE